MAEVQFAKTFLSTLDRRPVKLSSDFVSDPKKYPSQSPYTLPRPTHPFPTRDQSATSNSSSTISITLKPTKPTPEALTLTGLDPLQTTVLDLKTRFAETHSLSLSSVKILHAKRPAPDLKTLRDLLPTPTPKEAELGVMVLGGSGGAAARAEGVASPPPSVPVPAAFPPPPSAEAKEASAPLSEAAAGSGAEGGAAAAAAAGVGDEKFWGDLKDFLVQRLRDEAEGERLLGLFRGAVGSQ